MNKLVYDIGASNIKYAVMTDSGTILSRASIPTPRSGKDAYLSALEDIYTDNRAGIDGIAISTNGRMMPDGNTYRAYTMDFLTGVNIKTEMEKRANQPVTVENDGFAAAIGEWWKGAAAGTDNMMAVVLGSGMGGGLILNGKPYRGTRLNAAMNFAMLSNADTKNGKYRASGIDTSFSALLYMAAGAKQINPVEMNGEKLFEWAAQGDVFCLGLLEKYCRAVAVTVVNAALLLDLECIVITGGLAEQSMIIEGINRNVKDIALKLFEIDGFDLKSAGIGIDEKDMNVDIRQGTLTSAVNLYGALYSHIVPNAGK